MSVVLGIDIGGTFTDCVIADRDGSIHIGKATSTPPDFHVGFFAAIAAAGAQLGLDLDSLLAQTSAIYHGCTVGTNALVEGRTPPVALLTTRGHRDSIFTMQAGRRQRALAPEVIAHVAHHSKPEPVVPKHLVGEIHERVAHDGAVIAPLDEDHARAVIEDLLAAGATSFAISLIWSVVNDAHERRLAELVRDLAPDAYLSVASRVVRRSGEYERTVATVINALIGPEMDRYLAEIEARCAALGYHGSVHIMTCSGGVISMAEARALPVLTIGSGPVAGLIGAHRLSQSAAAGSQQARSDVITADMGGTTLDVGVIHRGTPLSRPTSWYQQYEYYTPTLDVRSVGAGGGSIIRYDEVTGTLRVGPESAGAYPGPACYQRGGSLATVTDADLVAGFLNPTYFLGGQMKLGLDAARTALERAGAPLGFCAEETAAAAIRIVDNHMADAVRLASVQQGLDPRRFELYAYGGAGPVHAAAVARALGIRTVVIPLSDRASVWSAYGIAQSDALVVEESAHTMTAPFDVELINGLWRQLQARVIERMATQAVQPEQIEFARAVDMRYPLQVNQVEVEQPTGRDGWQGADLIHQFESEYERIYGSGTGSPEAGHVITTLRVRGRSPSQSPPASNDYNRPAGLVTPVQQRQIVHHSPGGTISELADIYTGSVISERASITGPAIVELPDTSVVVRRGERLEVDRRGSLIIHIDKGAADA